MYVWASLRKTYLPIMSGKQLSFTIVIHDMDIVQQAIDYDVAIEMIQSMRVKAIKRMNDALSEEERQKAEQEIRLYNKEERILNYGEATAKESVYDKVFRFYGPMIREEKIE